MEINQEKNYKEILIRRIKMLCKEKGVSCNRAFLESKVGKNFISNLSKSDPSRGNLKLLADYLEVDPDFLIGKTEIRTRNIKTIHDNHGVIGDTHAPVTINNGMQLGDIEKELLSICGKLDMKRKNALLAKAYEILEEK